MAWVTWPLGQQDPSYNLGGWRWRGPYEPDALYEYQDIVTFAGGTWLFQSGGTTAPPPPDYPWIGVTARGTPGAAGTPGVDGVAGTPGVDGAQHASGPGGVDVGEIFDTALTWKAVALENGWTAGNVPPQWAREADGTVWLRGEALPGADSVVGHLPEYVLPATSHRWESATILGATSGTDPGALVAADPDNDVELSTSYKAANGTSGGSGGSGGGGDDGGQIEDPWWDGPVIHVPAGDVTRLYGCVTKAAGVAFPHTVVGNDAYPPLLLHLPMGVVPALGWDDTDQRWQAHGNVYGPAAWPTAELGVLLSVNDGPPEDITNMVKAVTRDNITDVPLNPAQLTLASWYWSAERWTADPWQAANKIELCFHGASYHHNWQCEGIQ